MPSRWDPGASFNISAGHAPDFGLVVLVELDEISDAEDDRSRSPPPQRKAKEKAAEAAAKFFASGCQEAQLTRSGSSLLPVESLDTDENENNKKDCGSVTGTSPQTAKDYQDGLRTPPSREEIAEVRRKRDQPDEKTGGEAANKDEQQVMN